MNLTWLKKEKEIKNGNSFTNNERNRKSRENFEGPAKKKKCILLEVSLLLFFFFLFKNAYLLEVEVTTIGGFIFHLPNLINPVIVETWTSIYKVFLRFFDKPYRDSSFLSYRSHSLHVDQLMSRDVYIFLHVRPETFGKWKHLRDIIKFL